MKKLLQILTLSLLFTSCVITQKQRDKFCSNCPQKTIIKDSIRKVIEYKDTIIYKTTPAVTHTTPSPCDSTGKLKDFKSTQTKNGLKTTIEGRDNELIVTCEADSLKLEIKRLNQKITEQHFRSETKTIKEPCDKDHKSDFDAFTNWWFYITGGLLILVLLYFFFLHRFVKRLPDI